MQVVSLNDSEAFAVLVRRYQAKILLLHRRLARDSGIAEDLCQETFFRAWDKMATLVKGVSPRGFRSSPTTCFYSTTAKVAAQSKQA